MKSRMTLTDPFRFFPFYVISFFWGGGGEVEGGQFLILCFHPDGDLYCKTNCNHGESHALLSLY